jgi:predicted flap endonuclease-1-like 5' DNA nuclease
VVAPKKAEQRAQPAAGPSPASIDDDLTVIKGIGPAVQKKLRELNLAYPVVTHTH